MRRHDFLRGLHRVAKVRNYLEIGIDDGKSLQLSRVPSIGIDPAFTIVVPLRGQYDIARTTSDEFFARKDPIKFLRSGRNPVRNLRRGRPLLDQFRGGTTLDLVFIDGMHLFEFALRDFMNVERFAHWGSVILFDDMLPRDVDEAARDRHTHAWAGDVFKVIEVLRTYRPDLTILPVDTKPTGTLLVLGADPMNRVLHDRYDEIIRDHVHPDPQVVPADILERRGALAPNDILAAPHWPDLVKARNRHSKREPGYTRLRDQLDEIRPSPRDADGS